MFNLYERKISFKLIRYREMIKENFNLNFNCKCQNTSNYSLGLEEFVFKYQSGDTKREEQYI